MRLFLTLVFLPLPVFADTISVGSTVTEVVLYPQGARVTREVAFSAPAGRHDLRIADLPEGIAPGMIRVSGAEGTQAGGFSLQEAGLAPAVPLPLPELEAAIAAAQAARDAALLDLARIDARIEAAEAQVGFLRGAKAEVTTQAPADLAAMGRMIAQEVLAVRESLLAAQGARAEAGRVVQQAEVALAEAIAARDARRAAQAGKALLSVAIAQVADGPGHLTVTHFIEEASWRPVYDAALTRKPAPSLVLARGALVSQESGEDWAGVALTLSTARPTEQAAPSELWPDLRRIADPEQERAYAKGMASEDAVMAAAPVMEAVMEPAMAELDGDVVVYRAPGTVDVASGVEDLRVALGELTFTPEIEARAVPRLDRTAFALARFTNGDEPLLPGEVLLMREGTLIGATELELIPAGAEAELPFGAIDGLRLTREMPQNSEGDAGILTSDTARVEKALLRVENLTQDSWPLHVIDQIPYSEQEDLEVVYSATPKPDETDPEGQRGLLGWHFDLAPGAKREILLEAKLRWPAGMELR